MPKKDILIIPDAHAHPDFSNNRFVHLGRFIRAVKPDLVVSVGDFADMAALSQYDKGKVSAEGRRYERDVRASVDALDKMMHECRRSNAKFFITLGNHEDRINRAASEAPELYGTLSTEDLQFEEYGWDVTPFREILELQGWLFSHYFSAGISGRGIGGQNAAQHMVKKKHCSCVQGHSHLLGMYEEVRGDGKRLTGLSVGCYVHPKMVEGWNKDTFSMWWRGVVLIRGAQHGQYDSLQFVKQEAMK